MQMIFALFTLLFCCCATAMQPDENPEPTSSPSSQTNILTTAEQPLPDRQRVFDHLTGNPQYKLAKPDKELRLEYRNEDRLGLRHLRFQQIFKGLEVWGHTIYAHVNRKDEVYRIDSKLAAIPPEFEPTFILGICGAKDMAIVLLEFDPTLANVEDPKKTIYVTRDGKPVAAYKVPVNQGSISYLALINALNGTLITKIDRIQNENP